LPLFVEEISPLFVILYHPINRNKNTSELVVISAVFDEIAMEKW